ncbi:MAG: hypothetical protein JOS17DRAFT_761621 [Linnemannia elongata]|nr:MAG: hypothetical protein JOS17DRAFT_761621 [Linnemannia elongata]
MFFSFFFLFITQATCQGLLFNLFFLVHLVGGNKTLPCLTTSPSTTVRVAMLEGAGRQCQHGVSCNNCNQEMNLFF